MFSRFGSEKQQNPRFRVPSGGWSGFLGIGTRINTGTVVGALLNIFGNGMPAKYAPSFSWGDSHTGNEETSTTYEAMFRAVAHTIVKISQA